MVLHPSVYAKLLGEKIKKHNVKCWLVNTGWTGGPYGTGHRMKIQYTRAMLNAALNGELDKTETYEDPYFGFQVPVAINGVPSDVLNPKNTWSDKTKYDEAAKKLVSMFHENFKLFVGETSEVIAKAGPKIL